MAWKDWRNSNASTLVSARIGIDRWKESRFTAAGQSGSLERKAIDTRDFESAA
jgi:hypothetical protein